MAKRSLNERAAAGLARGAICLALTTGATAAAEQVQGMTGFAKALRTAGWSVEVLVDGSLILTLAPDAESTPGSGVAIDTGGATEQPNNNADVEPGDWSVLRDLGWAVETDAEGFTLLYPPGAASPKAASAATRGDQAIPRADEGAPLPTPLPTAQDEVAQDLDAMLAARGWRTRRDADGSLLLFPLARAPESTSSLSPVGGVVTDAVRDGDVTLPIDSWSEAKTVTLSWLDSLGDSTLTLGRIRGIFRVYLVSIVDAEPPHSLRHQIAISVEEGRVILLN
jgi:hypothetical protein